MTHPVSWVIWMSAAVVAAWVGRNPLTLAIVLLCVQFVLSTLRRPAGADLPFTPQRFAIAIVPLSALFNALWTRAGDTVLFALPAWLPVLGGAITLEALAYGALNGLALACLFGAFSALNRAVPAHAAISLIPRALHPIAVVVVIAVSYVPFAVRQARAVRDAQAVRGHALRNARDWLPLFLPMLTGALEHALQLAEAMTARGYAHIIRTTGSAQWLVIGGLLLALGGWLLRTIGALPGWPLIAAGMALLGIVLWLLRCASPRSTYRRHRFGAGDALGVAGAVLALLATLAPLPGQATLTYTTYPVLTAPAFDPLIGGLLCGLSAPALAALLNARALAATASEARV
jgi:energy-coupling factor transport system permease protein